MLKNPPPLHARSSALIATVVGFGGTIALLVQALRTLGASVEQTGSAVTALCLGIAIGGAALSLRMRMPIVIAGLALIPALMGSVEKMLARRTNAMPRSSRSSPRARGSSCQNSDRRSGVS